MANPWVRFLLGFSVGFACGLPIGVALRDVVGGLIVSALFGSGMGLAVVGFGKPKT